MVKETVEHAAMDLTSVLIVNTAALLSQLHSVKQVSWTYCTVCFLSMCFVSFLLDESLRSHGASDGTPVSSVAL